MENTGTIIKNQNGHIVIQMDGANGAGCATCGAKHACSPAQGSRFVELKQKSDLQPGDRVRLEMGEARSIGLAFLLFILPIIFIIGSYILFDSLKWSEGLAILASLGSGIVVFLIVLGMEDSLMKKMSVKALGHEPEVHIRPLQQ